MTTIRVEHSKRYTCISNAAIQDQRLSLKARGLHHLLLSYPDNFRIKRDALVAKCDKDGRTAIESGLKELETFGYLTRKKFQNELGQWEWDSVIRENPTPKDGGDDSDSPSGGKPDGGLPDGGLPDNIISTDLTSTYLINTDQSNNSYSLYTSYTEQQAPVIENAPPSGPDDIERVSFELQSKGILPNRIQYELAQRNIIPPYRSSWGSTNYIDKDFAQWYCNCHLASASHYKESKPSIHNALSSIVSKERKAEFSSLLNLWEKFKTTEQPRLLNERVDKALQQYGIGATLPLNVANMFGVYYRNQLTLDQKQSLITQTEAQFNAA